ncbi:hypothetical protein GOV04_00580 [Candidatus Woesearchaeota archaeon]|nr:hypothetical protein [Candidatus Woesearchaeota archaeon]
MQAEVEQEFFILEGLQDVLNTEGLAFMQGCSDVCPPNTNGVCHDSCLNDKLDQIFYHLTAGPITVFNAAKSFDEVRLQANADRFFKVVEVISSYIKRGVFEPDRVICEENLEALLKYRGRIHDVKSRENIVELYLTMKQHSKYH